MNVSGIKSVGIETHGGRIWNRSECLKYVRREPAEAVVLVVWSEGGRAYLRAESCRIIFSAPNQARQIEKLGQFILAKSGGCNV